MILRVYRVQVVPELRDEFEVQFVAIKEEFVSGREGLVSVEIARPTEQAPNEFMMISRWNNMDAVRAFAGDSWTEPVIPEHMRKYMQQSWLHHYEFIGE